MTAMEFRLSPGAVRALGEYVVRTGLPVDEAAEELIMAGVDRAPGVGRSGPDVEGLEPRKQRFLALLEDFGEVSAACEVAVIAQGTPYAWARTDVEFARAFDATRARLRDARKGRADPADLLATAV